MLVVDHRPHVRRVVRAALSCTYDVAEAATGACALQPIPAWTPDLVLVGTELPDMLGSTLCRRLREDEEMIDVPILLLSSNRTTDADVEGMLAGADACVLVPVDPALLWAQVGTLIARRHRRASRDGRMQSTVTTAHTCSPFERQVRRIIETHLSDPDFSVSQLADEMALSPSQLYRRLQAEVDAAPSEFIRRTRLERAAELLEKSQGKNGHGAVSEVAYAVGFNSISYFGRCFRDYFESTPSAYCGRSAAGA